MRYEPIKEKIGSIIGSSSVLRKLYYFSLGVILLRAWHVKREIRRIFKSEKFSNVLDAGCGPGEYSYYLAKKFAAKVVGVDVIKSEIERCSRFAIDQKLFSSQFIVADLSSDSLPTTFSQKFDLVVSVDVMEHIKDDVAVFKNFNSVLRKGGKVIISTPTAPQDSFVGVPATGADSHKDHSADSISSSQGSHSESFIDEHFRDGYSPSEISDKLEKANLKVEKIAFTYGFGGSVYWKLIMKIPITLLNESIAFLLLLPFYYIIALPFSVLFMALDYYFPPKGGGGILVVARKD